MIAVVFSLLTSCYSSSHNALLLSSGVIIGVLRRCNYLKDDTKKVVSHFVLLLRLILCPITLLGCHFCYLEWNSPQRPSSENVCEISIQERLSHNL